MDSPVISRCNVNCVSKSSHQHISTPLQILLQMGIPKHRAEKALAATGGRSVQIAADWLLAHVNDPTLDDNTPREYILYLCPNGPLLEQLEEFFRQSMAKCGRNGAHNYLPHITLCSFFQAPDSSVPQLLHALQHVVEKLNSEIPDRIQLDHYTSPTFLGLFVAEEHNDSLKRLAVQFMREVSEYIVLEMGALDVLSTCFPWCSSSSSSLTKGMSRKRIQVEPYLKALHITLSYQFEAENYSTLESLSREIDVNSAANWELKLFSRDSRIKGKEVFRVRHSYNPRQEPREMELIIGDFIYASPDILGSEGVADGWTEGISWLTGCPGLFAKDYVQKVAESDAWTLHKSVRLMGGAVLGEVDEPSLVSSRLPLNSLQHGLLNSEEQTGKQNNHSQEPSKLKGDTKVLLDKMEVAEKFSKPRRIFITRHAERMDFTFGQWISMCTNFKGKYTRKDLNMPHNVPLRNGSYQDYLKDCPLTMIGLYQATLTGMAFKESEINLAHAFCSPSLRCVQTCTNILKAAGLSHVSIHIEPGLFEWLAWYQDGKPSWLTPEETKLMGFNVATEYKPVVTLEEMRNGNETSEQYYMRSFYVTQSVLKSTARQGGDVLIVAHAASLDTCTRQLTGREHRSTNELVRITHKAPYCGVSVVQEKADGKWELIETPFAPLTHTGNVQFDWKCLLT